MLRIIDGLQRLTAEREDQAIAPEQRAPLAAAAARKRANTLHRAHAALRELDQRGEPIIFQAVARHASVSRQRPCQQPELRAEIEQLRARHARHAPAVPARERASDASLRQRLETALADNRRLRNQITALKTELALAYGAQRAAQR